ncbi:hypothetical protein JYP51_11545 [Ponticoccus gilvus]|nr:hypothetical protein [Enemella evansiae]
MTKDIHSRPLFEKDRIAEEQTDRFTDDPAAGRKKHPETSDDIAEGMPATDRETLKDETGTK